MSNSETARKIAGYKEFLRFYCEAAERQMATPSLFDMLAEPESQEVGVVA
jgi:hypothetical protein